MVRQCSIILCKHQYNTGDGITYHAFPTKDAERMKKWINAIPANLINKITESTYICNLHFRPENYHDTPLGRNVLKKDAIPTGFELFPHDELEKTNQTTITNINMNVDQERTGKRCAEENMNDDAGGILFEVEETKDDASTQTLPKRLKRTPIEEMLMKKVDNLQKCLRRRDAKISILEEVIKVLNDTSRYSESVRDILEKHLSDEKLEFLLNEANSNDVSPTHREYPEEVKQFALTIYFYSSKAYEVLQKYLHLPDGTTIIKWMETYNCERGLSTQDFNYLEDETKKSISELLQTWETWKTNKDEKNLMENSIIGGSR